MARMMECLSAEMKVDQKVLPKAEMTESSLVEQKAEVMVKLMDC